MKGYNKNMATAKEQMMDIAKRELGRAVKAKETFGTEFQKDANGAADFHQTDFERAMGIKVWKCVIKSIEDGISLEAILDVATRSTIRGAINPMHSTSTLCNLAINM
jgi:hypothetical protein